MSGEPILPRKRKKVKPRVKPKAVFDPNPLSWQNLSSLTLSELWNKAVSMGLPVNDDDGNGLTRNEIIETIISVTHS